MIERVKKVMEFAEVSPARFAEVIGINRAAMSHYLSGRNNPSLDVLNKILDVYSEINPIWLYRGIGEMFTAVDTDVNSEGTDVTEFIESSLFTNVTEEEIPIKEEVNPVDQILSIEENNTPLSTSVSLPALPLSRAISKIIVYYTDQTFEIFTKDELPIF